MADFAGLPTKRRVIAILVGATLIVVAGAVGFTALTLSWAYSDGERSGTLLKISRKGWVCKTWEGELTMALVASGAVPGDQAGISTNTWAFSVRDDAIAEKLNAAAGKRVSLHYTEHKGVPSTCFGETPYFVDAVRLVE